MKKYITALLACLLVLSLSVAAFADEYAQNEADYNDMFEYAAKQTPAITLTDQYFSVEGVSNFQHYKLELTTESEDQIDVFLCVLLRGIENETIAGIAQMHGYAIPVQTSSPVVSFSKSESYEYPLTTSDMSKTMMTMGARVGVNVLTEVSEPTDITLKIYAKERGSFTEEDSPSKTVTFTIQPKTSTQSDAIALDISGPDRSNAATGLQVYAGDEVTVGFTVPEGFNGTGASFTYDSDVFELVGSAPSGWVEAGGMYSYAVPSDGVTSDSLGEFKFKAKAQSSDNAKGEFTVTSSYSGSTENKVETGSVDVIFKTIQYEIENVQSISGFNQVTTTYNGQPQHVAINVTEPAEYAIQYAYGSYTTSPEKWTDSVPEFTDVSNLNNSTYVHFKISADGYKTAQGLVDFYIRKATVNIAVNDVTINAGDPLPTTFKYTFTGFYGDDALLAPPTISCAQYNGEPGTYTIRAAGAKVSDNYRIEYVHGTLTVNDVWIVKLDDTEYKVLKGDPFTFPSAPTKPGYIFLGWRGADGVTYQPGDEVEITADTSFKAIWANMPDITPGTPDVPDDEPDVDVFPFYDVSVNAWYYDAVKYVWDNGLMNGTGTAEFSPNTTLNRAMVWTILARLDGVDVDGGATWYSKAQEWAMAEGVSDGTDPMGAVTREQLVTMLWRFKGEPAVDFLLTSPDADTISDWAREAMRWAVSNGIIEGDENGCITPTATATRAQAAAIFMRFVEQ